MNENALSRVLATWELLSHRPKEAGPEERDVPAAGFLVPIGGGLGGTSVCDVRKSWEEFGTRTELWGSGVRGDCQGGRAQ